MVILGGNPDKGVFLCKQWPCKQDNILLSQTDIFLFLCCCCCFVFFLSYFLLNTNVEGLSLMKREEALVDPQGLRR